MFPAFPDQRTFQLCLCFSGLANNINRFSSGEFFQTAIIIEHVSCAAIVSKNKMLIRGSALRRFAACSIVSADARNSPSPLMGYKKRRGARILQPHSWCVCGRKQKLMQLTMERRGTDCSSCIYTQTTHNNARLGSQLKSRVFVRTETFAASQWNYKSHFLFVPLNCVQNKVRA
jgi:hypothetical protein